MSLTMQQSHSKWEKQLCYCQAELESQDAEVIQQESTKHFGYVLLIECIAVKPFIGTDVFNKYSTKDRIQSKLMDLNLMDFNGAIYPG